MSGLHILGLLEHRDFSFLKQKGMDQDDDDDGADTTMLVEVTAFDMADTNTGAYESPSNPSLAQGAVCSSKVRAGYPRPFMQQVGESGPTSWSQESKD